VISPEERLVMARLKNRGWVRGDAVFDSAEQEHLEDLVDAGMVKVRKDYYVTSLGLRELERDETP
jgi:hypothetical protein